MKYKIFFSTEDISKFYYKRDIGIKNRILISKKIYNNDKAYILKEDYKDEKYFIREVEDTLNKMTYKKELKLDSTQIEIIKDELKLDIDIFQSYMLKTSSGEEYLKQIRLNLDFYSNRRFVYMKLRTLMNEFGYKRRSINFIEILNETLNNLDLYIAVDGNKVLDNLELLNRKLDSNIRIYRI